MLNVLVYCNLPGFLENVQNWVFFDFLAEFSFDCQPTARQPTPASPGVARVKLALVLQSSPIFSNLLQSSPTVLQRFSNSSPKKIQKRYHASSQHVPSKGLSRRVMHYRKSFSFKVDHGRPGRFPGKFSSSLVVIFSTTHPLPRVKCYLTQV